MPLMMPMTIVSDCDGGDFDDSLCDNLSVPFQYYLTTTAFVVSLRGCGGGGGIRCWSWWCLVLADLEQLAVE
jgi:hypothetical protein